MPINEQLKKVLVCPKCRGRLSVHGKDSSLDCHRCNLSFPVRDGIPVMLIDEAEKITA